MFDQPLYSGIIGGDTEGIAPWQAKCKNHALLSLYFGFSFTFDFQ